MIIEFFCGFERICTVDDCVIPPPGESISIGQKDYVVRLAPNRKATRRAAPASRRRPAAGQCDHLGFSPCGCVLTDESR